MKRIQTICIALALILTPVLATAAPTQTFTPEQTAAVEKIVRELLTKKDPGIVIAAAKTYQEKVETKIAAKGKLAIKTEAKEIYYSPTSPVAGNPKGDVSVVEFFDYACGYCKQAQSSVVKLIKEDKNVRFVFKELPIFGKSSVLVSKAALASVRQGKYIAFHMALLKAKQRLNETRLMAIAKKVGLDTAKLKKDMNDKKIADIIEANQALASKLGVNGTPAFIIAGKLYPGAVPLKKMKELIAAARAAKK